MPYRGKIGCHFPQHGNPNWDVSSIRYLPAGAGVDEIHLVNCVYAIPAGVDPSTISTPSDLDQYVVWELELSEQQVDVCIAYTPLHDVTVHHIGIFTAENISSTSVDVKIYHESGLVLAQITGDSVSAAMTKYGITGYVRTVTVNNVVFHAGETYYIQYTDQQQGTAFFWPAYFAGEEGTYRACKNHDSKSIADMNSNTYIGYVNDVDEFIEADNGEYMVWDGDYTLNPGTVYVRNNMYHGTYAGSIGTGNVSNADKDSILRLSSGSIFKWSGYNADRHSTDGISDVTTVLTGGDLHQKNSYYDVTKYKGIKSTAKDLLNDLSVDDYAIYDGPSVSGELTNGWLYKKTDNVTVDVSYTTISGGGQFDFTDVLNILDYSYGNGTGNVYVGVTGYICYRDVTGTIYRLKSTYTIDFNKSGDTYIGYDKATQEQSGTSVSNCLYYVTSGGQTGLYTWDGNSLNLVMATYGDINSFLNLVDAVYPHECLTQVYFYEAVDHIGGLNLLYDTTYSGNYISNTFRQAPDVTGNKYYLEINGREV